MSDDTWFIRRSDLVIILYQPLDQDGFVGLPHPDLIFLHLQQLLEYFLFHLKFPDDLLCRGGHSPLRLTRAWSVGARNDDVCMLRESIKVEKNKMN